MVKQCDNYFGEVINMQIQSVGQTVKPKTVESNTALDSQIKALNKQEQELQKQIQDLQKPKNKSGAGANQSAEESKAIQDQIKELQKQIAQINQQIAELQSEKFTKPIQQQSPAKNEETVNDKLIKCENNISDVKTKYSAKRKLQGSANVLKVEIELDKARGLDTTKKEKTLSNMNENIKKMDKDLGKSVVKAVKESETKIKKDEDEQKEENDPDKWTDEELKSNFIDEKA